MRNVLDRFVGKTKTHILSSIIFSKNRAVYEIMLKNMVQPDPPQMAIQHGARALRAG
jgi:hypothetical protein